MAPQAQRSRLPAREPDDDEEAVPDAPMKQSGSPPAKQVAGGATAAPKKTPPADAGPVPARKTQRPREPRRPATLPSAPTQEVAALLKELQDPQLADAAFLRLWEIPKAYVPELISEVENSAPSRVERLHVLVLDSDFVGHGKPFLANRVHGLGKMEVIEEVARDDFRVVSQAYTKIGYQIPPNKRGYKLVMEKFGGFPIGVVVRAGLINRFQSTRYPSQSDDETEPGKLIDWWREFYMRSSAQIPPP